MTKRPINFPRCVPPALLGWYDQHARDLPWRVSPAKRQAGERPDPYRIWLSEIMLQQTTVATVKAYFERFTARWPDIHALASEDREELLREWAGLGYYARARNLHACAKVISEDYGGAFPQDAAGLRALPGIGPYTSAAIAAIAFDLPETVVDGNVERVMARLFAVQDPLPGAKPNLARLAATLTPAKRPGDYAQAVMDLGATICTPRSPACGICPLLEICTARREGIAAELPRKDKKKPKPTRLGFAYVALRAEGSVLLAKRPDKGLLGGMTEFPGSDWTETPPEAGAGAPMNANWEEIGEVRHTFTHFHLVLRVLRAELPSTAKANRGSWVAQKDAQDEALPTLMQKILNLAL